MDGLGGASFYSLIDRYEVAQQERLLPVGLAKDATLVRRVSKDQPITYDDAELHEPSAILDLRRLQDAWMAGSITDDALVSSMDAMAGG
jgi:predicted homoserine dehydrogenase-like protein